MRAPEEASELCWELVRHDRTRARELAEEALGSDPAAALTCLAACHCHDSDFARARDLAVEAIELSSGPALRPWKARALSVLGQLHTGRGDYAIALGNLHEALEIHRAVGHGIDEADALHRIGQVYAHLGATAAASRSDDDAAAIYAREGLVPSREPELTREPEHTVLAAARRMLDAGETSSAREALDGALRDAERRGDEALVAELHDSLSRVHEAEGGLHAAFEHYRLHLDARSAIFDRRSEQRLCALQVLHRVAHERGKANEAQQRVETELRALPQRVLAAQEGERETIARELNEDVNQRLVAIANDLAGVEHPTADGLRERLVMLARDLHTLGHQIHPGILDELGFVGAANAEARRQAELCGWDLEVACDEPPESVTDEVALALYRVLQESLRNIAKHARAGRVQVAFEVAQDGAVLRVEDDGAGFDPVRASGGVGLASMRERLELCGGSLGIRSSPGEGVQVEARVPWS